MQSKSSFSWPKYRYFGYDFKHSENKHKTKQMGLHQRPGIGEEIVSYNAFINEF